MNSPRSPRNLTRSQRGNTRPPAQVEVKTGSARIEQLSTPRYRVTGNDWQNHGASLGGYSSPRLSNDQRTVFLSTEKMMKRVQNQHRYPYVSPRRTTNEQSLDDRTATLVPEIPSATKLLKNFQHEHEHDKDRDQTTHRVPLFPTVNHHDGNGIAGLILSQSSYLDDQQFKQGGTKAQKHELCNTQVPLAMQEGKNFPVYVPTSGRRAKLSGGGGDSESNDQSIRIVAPEPSAVRSLAISGIDTSRAEARPSAPEYFTKALSADLNPRPTRNGSNKHIKYPETSWMSQAKPDSGHYSDSASQFNPNDRGLHSASTYVLEDKLRRKATDEVRISKCGWNEDAVAERAMAEIAKKKARTDKRVAAKRKRIADYENRVGAGM